MTAAEGRAFAVHLLTASGAALAFASLVVAVDHRWTLMFELLGLALIVDGVDGGIARRLKVKEVLPRWNGDVLDLVVDFSTYVFVPAYAIGTGGLLPDLLGPAAGIAIVVTSAIYFADRRMKTADNYFRGFPGLWNGAAFYLFLLNLSPWSNATIVAVLLVLTFVPFKFLHPLRVVRLRGTNLLALTAWSVLAAVALWSDLEPGWWVTWGLVIIAVYFLGVGLTDPSGTQDSAA